LDGLFSFCGSIRRLWRFIAAIVGRYGNWIGALA
jgi:hypothetical protein